MLPRLLPAVIILLTAACAQKQDSSSSAADSLVVDSVSTAAVPGQAPAVITFVDNELFTRFLPFDLDDPDGWRQWLPEESGECDGFDNEDGTRWYEYCSFGNERLSASFYEFHDSDPHRFYFFDVHTTDAGAVFAKGIHAGMSKREFLDAVKITDPKAATTEAFSAVQEPGGHTIFFQFEDDVLKSIDIKFDYEGGIPNTISSLVDNWTQIYVNEAEGQVEYRIPCGPQGFALEEFYVDINPEKTVTKYLLTTDMVQDSRVDTVEWIRRTSNGFIISAFNSQNSQHPYTTEVVFKDEDWALAEWDNVMFGKSLYSGSAYRDECEGEEP